MDIYLAGTNVTLTVPLVDKSGNALTVASVDYRIINSNGVEVLPRTNLADYGGDAEAVISIPANVNTVASIDPMKLTANDIDAYFVREARTVELFITDTNGNVITLSASYGLEPSDVLVVGMNTFQTLAHAEMFALDMSGMSGWSGATDHDKTAALIEARQHICQMRFAILNSNINWGQDNLNYVPEGTYVSSYAGMFMFNGNLTLLTPSNFVNLPQRFRAALCRGQVAEADAILGGDPVDVRRQEGLMLESIGEVKQMYRSSKPVDLPVCKRAMKYLGPFVTLTKTIARG